MIAGGRDIVLFGLGAVAQQFISDAVMQRSIGGVDDIGRDPDRRPALAIAVLRSTLTVSQNRNFGSQAPDFDRVTAEDLVENLNTMGYAAFSNVSEEVCIFQLL